MPAAVKRVNICLMVINNSLVIGLSSPEMTDSTKYEYLHNCLLLQRIKTLCLFIHFSSVPCALLFN